MPQAVFGVFSMIGRVERAKCARFDRNHADSIENKKKKKSMGAREIDSVGARLRGLLLRLSGPETRSYEDSNNADVRVAYLCWRATAHPNTLTQNTLTQPTNRPTPTHARTARMASTAATAAAEGNEPLAATLARAIDASLRGERQAQAFLEQLATPDLSVRVMGQPCDWTRPHSSTHTRRVGVVCHVLAGGARAAPFGVDGLASAPRRQQPRSPTAEPAPLLRGLPPPAVRTYMLPLHTHIHTHTTYTIHTHTHIGTSASSGRCSPPRRACSSPRGHGRP